MVEIFLLEQLAAFAKWGTLSQAAAELGITQPALSHSMKKLEEEIGVPLFERSKSKITLNETGRVAARYARKVLEADKEMLERTREFDRSQRTIILGACAALPINRLLPVLQENFPRMAVTTEITEDEKLISGLKRNIYQLAVVHEPIRDPDIFAERYFEEHLSITVPTGHFLADREKVSFRDLEGISILGHGGAGFWIGRCQEKLKGGRILLQDSIDVLGELVDASRLPAFNSDSVPGKNQEIKGRVILPISDQAAQATYYLACLETEKERYQAVFAKACLESEK